MFATIAVNGQPLPPHADSLAVPAVDFYEWQPIEITCALPNVVAAQLIIEDTELGAPTTTLGDPTLRWQWNPQHAVGQYRVLVSASSADGSTHTARFSVRIVPRKLDLLQYEALIAAVQQDVRALVYTLSGGREAAHLQRNGQPRSLIEEYVTLVEGHVVQALAITKQIAARPHQALTDHAALVPLPEAAHIAPHALRDLLHGPLDQVEDDIVPALQTSLRPAEQTQGGPLPRHVRVQRTVATQDVVEHRVLKQVLQVLLGRVGWVREAIRRELIRCERNAAVIDQAAAPATLNAWALRCAQAMRQLRGALALPFVAGAGVLATLPTPTHLMRHDPRYRRLFTLYRQLQATPLLACDSPLLWLPIHDLPQLYERWCVLQVIKAVVPLGLVVEQRLVERENQSAAPADARWTLRLRHNEPLLVVRLPNNVQLAVIYQRRYAPQAAHSATLGAIDPFVRIPDIAIEIVRPDAPPAVLVLDAKYRAAPDGRIPQAALDDAYTYRGAIGVGGVRATVGSWLLFPGTQPVRTADHVGALPLVPDQSHALADLIRQFVGA